MTQKKIAMIGLGHMGNMLTRQFILSGAAAEENFFVSDRATDNINRLKTDFPKANIANDNISAAKSADLIFLCVRPLDALGVLSEIVPHLKPETHIVSVAAAVEISKLSAVFGGRITRVIPSITGEIFKSYSLISFSDNVDGEGKIDVLSLFNSIGKSKVLSEADMALATDVTSCSPGLFAAMFDEFVKSATRKSVGLSESEIAEMTLYTVQAVTQQLMQKNKSFAKLLEEVATKGGITEAGASVLLKKLPEVFDEMIAATLSKNAELAAKI